ncbi:MAG: hypothetical protein P8103_20490, partial [Candidatus Thiodiazotropha sp.]
QIGQLGNGAGARELGTPKSTPVAVQGLSDAAEVGTGAAHSCARRKTGQVVCWGGNDRGQLGSGTETNWTTRVPVKNITGAVSLSVGLDHSCVAQRDGSDKRKLSEIDRLAQEYQQQGHTTDAYLLWFYAARQGDGKAAFALASLYDPNHFQSGSTLVTAADATQAYKWYSTAARQSIPEAAERLQALRARLESQAESGDMSARRLLLNWQ